MPFAEAPLFVRVPDMQMLLEFVLQVGPNGLPVSDSIQCRFQMAAFRQGEFAGFCFQIINGLG